MLTQVSSCPCMPARSHTSQLGSLGSSSSHLVSIAWCWSPELHQILPILSVSLSLKCWINHNVVNDTLSHHHSESMHSPPPRTCFHSLTHFMTDWIPVYHHPIKGLGYPLCALSIPFHISLNNISFAFTCFRVLCYMLSLIFDFSRMCLLWAECCVPSNSLVEALTPNFGGIRSWSPWEVTGFRLGHEDGAPWD